jgi:serine protease
MLIQASSLRRPRFLAILVLVVSLLLGSCGGGGGGSAASAPPPATFTLSGGVVAAAGNATDSDVNDPLAPYTANDSMASAQEIPDPVNVGGFVNQPGARNASPGRSQASGDISDYFHAALVSGQQITLSIADIVGDGTTPDDLDLFLYDQDGNPVASSEGTGSTESITVPADGTYFIQVFAKSGASNYLLSIGQGGFTQVSGLSVLDDFVPGEVIVRFRPAAAPKTGASLAVTTLSGQVAMAVRRGGGDREMLLSLPATAVATQAAAPVRAGFDPAKAATIDAIKALRRRADVLSAEPNRRMRLLLTPNDSNYPLQWHYPLINLPQAWDITTGDRNVIVAVVDSGVLLAHPDLQGQLIAGYDFVSDPQLSLDGDGIDNNPDDPGGTGRTVFHGTHVAGTIGAATNNATGVAGINWQVSIMPVRVITEQGGTSYDVLQGVRYAAGLPNDSGTTPAQPADVINLSLGCSDPCTCQPSSAEQDVYTQVRNRGIIVVAAAGNSSSSCPSYPAAYSGVVSVSAVDINRNRAPYSNYGSTIDVAAPGGDGAQDINGDGYPDGVLSTAGTDNPGGVQPAYSFLQGTSMAAPHVTGVIALMRAVNPSLGPAAFDNLLASGQLTQDLGAAGRDDLYGYGLIDAYKAVVAAGGTPAGATLVATPAALNFGTYTTSLSLALENGGGGVLSIDAPTDDAAWLTVTAGTVDANGIGRYTVQVGRNGLAAGTYTATIHVTSSANALDIPVVMQVSNATFSADAGYQYTLLLDVATGATLRQVEGNPTNGRYPYSFGNLDPGSYQVVSGTDLNNDQNICDPGESCGAWLTAASPATINLNADLVLPDFITSYQAGFSTLSAATGGTVRPYRRIDGAVRRLP